MYLPRDEWLCVMLIAKSWWGQRWKVSDERFGTRETGEAKMNRAIRLWELKLISQLRVIFFMLEKVAYEFSSSSNPTNL